MKLIDAHAELKKLKGIDKNLLDKKNKQSVRFAKELLHNAPTMDAALVKHGHWELLLDDDENKYYKCSNCGYYVITFSFINKPIYIYCSQCGAKMDDEE